MKKKFTLLLVKKTFYIFLLLLCTGLAGYAQDTSVVDSTAVAEPETKVTDQRHLYDSSERFFNQKLYNDQPLTDEKLVGKLIPQRVIDSIKKADDFWYVNAIEKFKQKQSAFLQQQQNASVQQPQKGRTRQYDDSKPPDEDKPSLDEDEGIVIGGGLQYIIFGAAIIIFLGAIVYFLSTNKVGLFAPRNKEFDDGNNNETDIGDNIFILPYKDLLDKALKENNFRLATRILYLQTLKMLAESNIINFKPDFTNIHYLMQLSNTSYYKDFFKVTRHYEYVWYGKFDVSKNTYETISNDFAMMQKKIAPSYE